jgi:hypothetical protein
MEVAKDRCGGALSAEHRALDRGGVAVIAAHEKPLAERDPLCGMQGRSLVGLPVETDIGAQVLRERDASGRHRVHRVPGQHRLSPTLPPGSSDPRRRAGRSTRSPSASTYGLWCTSRTNGVQRSFEDTSLEQRVLELVAAA